MTIQRTFELMKIEYECLLRNYHNECYRDCANCNIVQTNEDLLHAYHEVLCWLNFLSDNGDKPHVMSYDELSKLKIGDVVYKEARMSDSIDAMTFDGTAFVGSSDYLLLCECNEEDCVDYNFDYRCWDHVPDMRLRKDTPWKPDPYIEDTK